MSFLLRMLSPSYRRATIAEAGGNYLVAAQAYALCGQRDKVCEMHLLEAERVGDRDAKVAELRIAVHFVDRTTESGRGLLRRLAQSYLALLRRGVVTDRDQLLCREGAELALRGGDPSTAAKLYELLGDEAGVANAYQEAGELERLESVLQREERRRNDQDDLRQSLEQHHLHELLGERGLALRVLREGLATAGPHGDGAGISAAAAPGHREARQRLAELEALLLPAGRVVLRRGAVADQQEQTTLYVGAFPLLLGRGDECALPLRDAGISRTHASISFTPPSFVLHDLHSKNGTTLNGLRVAGEIPLRGTGQIGLGDHSVLAFTVEGSGAGSVLGLRIERGLDRGLLLRASPGPMPLGPPGVELRFEDGFPLIICPEGVLLHGRRAPRGVQLVRGDTVEAGGVTFGVVG